MEKTETTVKPTAKKQEPSVYEVLSSIDISVVQQQKGDKKDSPKYISWATAWDTVKKRFPKASYEVLKPFKHAGEHSDKLFRSNNHYFSDGTSCWVEVVVSVPGNTETQIGEKATVSLPVMSWNNKAVLAGNVLSTDVNNSTMRALTKGLALCGFGIQMWIKDDVLARIDENDVINDPKEAEGKANVAPQKPAPKKSSAPKKGSNDPAPKAEATKKNPNKPSAPKKELMVLTDTHDNWDMVLKYVASNKHLGIDQIVKNLSVKYEIGDEVKTVLKDEIDG